MQNPLKCYFWFAVLVAVSFVGAVWEAIIRNVLPLAALALLLVGWYVALRLAVGF
jgi:hypothetical protein